MAIATRCSPRRSGSVAHNSVRQYVLDRFREEVNNEPMNEDAVAGWKTLLSSHRINTILKLSRGLVKREVTELDADPELLNTPAEVVNLRTLDVYDHHPDFLMTYVTSGSYIKGYTHVDWEKALEALSPDERNHMQLRFGQAITGEPSPDDAMVVLRGSGENGKTAITTAGLVPAFGRYAHVASTKLFEKGEHPTQLADLRGRRLVISEEISEIDVDLMKRFVGTSYITARNLYKDNFTFRTTHSMFVTTNYETSISKTDHGTWRRFLLVVFPYTFRKKAEDVSHRVQPSKDSLGAFSFAPVPYDISAQT
jgi:putative DNA primase/helicase